MQIKRDERKKVLDLIVTMPEAWYLNPEGKMGIPFLSKTDGNIEYYLQVDNDADLSPQEKGQNYLKMTRDGTGSGSPVSERWTFKMSHPAYEIMMEEDYYGSSAEGWKISILLERGQTFKKPHDYVVGQK